MLKKKYQHFYILMFISMDSHANYHQISDLNISKNLSEDISFASFNPSSLFGHNNRNINLENFQVKNKTLEGTYLVKLNVNNKAITETNVRFIKLGDIDAAVLCIDNLLLSQLNLTKEVYSSLPKLDCLKIEDISKSANYDFDISKLILNVYIPQAFQAEHPEGYINPKLFDKGINSAFISYNYNINHNNDRISEYLNLRSGINFKGWYFRHQGNFDSEKTGLGSYRPSENVLHTDLIPIHSRLSLGQFSTQNYQLESLPIVGAQIVSDQTMLPTSQQTYSPIIENIANTNAIVKVYQNGIQIYERTVPAGPFKISDLGSINQGDLIVEIIENNGDIKNYKINLQKNLNLIRPGHYYYSVSIGNYYFSNKITNEFISQINYGYGLNNKFTLLGGINASNLYKSLLMGVSVSSNIGGINFKTNLSNTKIDSDNYSGNQYSFDYRYIWENLGISLYLDKTYQSKDYLTVSNTLSRLNFSNLSNSEYKNYIFTNSLKDSFSFNISKSKFMSSEANFNLSYASNRYWNNKNSTQQYSFNYNNIWNNLSYTLGYSQTSYSSLHTDDKTIYISFSMPFNWSKNRLFLNSNIQNIRNDNNINSANLNVSGSLGTQNNFNYGAGISNTYRNGDTETSLQAYGNYLLPKVSLGATAYSHDDNQQYSLSARGALVAHRFGITPVNLLSDTFTIVHVENGKGTKINNAWGVTLDHFGNAIYPNNSAYSENDISLDPQDLPIDLILESNQTRVIPRKFSSTLAVFNTKKTSNLLLRLSTEKEIQLPIGSHLLNQDGTFIGLLGQSNQVIVENKNDLFEQPLKVVWGNEMNESCAISPISLSKIKTDQENHKFEILNVECF
jgi:outer membrane usher protein